MKYLNYPRDLLLSFVSISKHADKHIKSTSLLSSVAPRIFTKPIGIGEGRFRRFSNKIFLACKSRSHCVCSQVPIKLRNVARDRVVLILMKGQRGYNVGHYAS